MRQPLYHGQVLVLMASVAANWSACLRAEYETKDEGDAEHQLVSDFELDRIYLIAKDRPAKCNNLFLTLHTFDHSFFLKQLNSTKLMENLASKWKTVWITGASSGIGKELTQRFAQSGVKVAASARSEKKLAQLAADNPNVHPYPLDVTDNEAVLAATKKIVEDLGPIDLAILNAGTYLRQRADIAFSAKLCRDTMDVNFGGVANCVEGLLPNMLARDAGHVSIVASVAGLRGLPNASAYSPTKAACISLCESLSLDLQETNLKVSVINPGFVETPLIEGNDFWMPFLITPNVAANSIIDGLKKSKYDITFPWPMRLTMKSLKSMPNKLYFLIMRPVARARAAAAREETEIPTKT